MPATRQNGFVRLGPVIAHGNRAAGYPSQAAGPVGKDEGVGQADTMVDTVVTVFRGLVRALSRKLEGPSIDTCDSPADSLREGCYGWQGMWAI